MQEGKVFYSRHGMQRSEAMSRQDLRRLLATGLIDSDTLIGVGDDSRMLPLGASEAASEISWTVRFWRLNHSPAIYCVWLIFVPLLAGGVAGGAITYGEKAWYLIPLAIFFAKVGLSFWLYRTWRVLLAGESIWKAFWYAFPMCIPMLSCFWIWIGYMPMLKYWRKFVSYHHLSEKIPYKLYYLVMIVFYLHSAASLIWLGIGLSGGVLVIEIAGLITWLWFGLTLLSLFITDRITTLLIRQKLQNLSYGALKFCANINYDAVEKVVAMLSLCAKKSFLIFTAVLLLISYLASGWFWMRALEVYQTEYISAQTAESESNQSSFRSTKAVRLGK